jgi:hypothetical protein
MRIELLRTLSLLQYFEVSESIGERNAGFQALVAGMVQVIVFWVLRFRPMFLRNVLPLSSGARYCV